MSVKGPDKKSRLRIWLMISVCVIGFTAVVGRLLWMQVYKYDYYNYWADYYQTRDTILQPKRGSILSSDMVELAVSAATTRVEISPPYIVNDVNSDQLGYSEEEQRERTAALLAEYLSLDYETVLNQVNQVDQGGLTVAQGVEDDVIQALRAEITRLNSKDENGNYPSDRFVVSGVSFVQDYRRYYPMGEMAAQVVGFMHSDGYGQQGIEASYEDELAGSPGRIVRTANASGGDMPVEYEQYVEAQDGNSVITTIDTTIQGILEKHLATAMADNPQANGGVSGVVMNVKTGEILAMANLPQFDPNTPRVITSDVLLEKLQNNLTERLTEAGISTGISEKWLREGGIQNLTAEQRENEELLDILTEERLNMYNQMWRNQPVIESYEPGSVFKLFNVAVAMEEHAITADSTFNCTGGMWVDEETHISCHKKEGHGVQTTTQALMNSCNVAMMQMAFQMGADTFYEYFKAFGMLEKTGVDLAEPISVQMHSLDSLRKTKSTLATSSFGQRFMITPLQMLNTVCAIVDDGKLKTPHVMREIVAPDGTVKETASTEVVRQVISAETSAFMREAMEQVVAEGTGQNAYVAGYRIGGKTATSELSLPGTPQDEQRFTASFIGVAPIDDPEVAVLVVISDLPYEAPHGGGAIAAPVVGRIMNELLPYIGVEPQYDESEADRRELSVPAVVGQTKAEAEEAIQRAGLTCRFLGEGDTVSDQVPSSGVKIPAGSEMIVYLGGRTKTTEKVEVPNLIGDNPESVAYRLELSNLYLRRTGVATDKYNWQTTAVKQNPAAGTMVNVGTVIEVEFSNTSGVEDR